MFGGGGNPRKMKQMMEQMGIDFEELEAEEVVIRLDDDTELYFPSADVTRMDARGQQTYQVVGDPEERARESGEPTEEAKDDATDEQDPAIPQDDVELVATRTGVSDEEARAALEAVDGDLAAAVDRLE
ncbi:MAG: nascent polypeptide-associated complex protein [Halobacteriaceae archaeon]